MASESISDSHQEDIRTRTSPIAPPRLPPPTGLQLPQSHSRQWSSSSSQYSFARVPDVTGSEAEALEQRTAASRHLRLPPLDTSQVSHRSLSRDQLPAEESDHYPSKRRRVEAFQVESPPNLVTRSDLGADSSSRLSTRAGYRQDPRHETYLYSKEYQSDTLNHAARAAVHNEPAWRSHAEYPARGAGCCSPGCQGPSCARLRSIVQDLVTEICTRDPHVSGATSTSEFLPPKPILPEATEIDTSDALEWALQRLRWNNSSLRNLLSTSSDQPSEPSPPLLRRASYFGVPQERMKRQHEAVDKDTDPNLQHQSRQYQFSAEQSSQNTPLAPDSWRLFEGMDPPGQPPSRHYRSSSFSYGPAQPSPSQSSQAARMLPSPSSLNLPIPPTLPSISSPSPGSTSAAHLAHLQDLQHQVSVKQLALQTLQREYDSLLQKLERQRVKSQALEKKFEVSDAEINSLTDEKERLAGQVQVLEAQVDELQISRDEARKMGADSAAQYMKIVEMAGRLQGKGVEDKKTWEKERDTLVRRITELEGGQPPRSSHSSLTGSGHQSPGPMDQAVSPMRQLSEQISAAQLSRTPILSTTQPDDTAALRQEIFELKDRIAALESALKEALDESKAVREAALSLASAGQRLEQSATSALGQATQRAGQQ